MRYTGCFLLLLAGTPGLHAASDPRLKDAVKRGDVDAVRTLLRAGADANAADPDGSTPLHWAAHPENLEITNPLLTAGAKPAVSSRYKITPLALAAEAGNAPIVERLLTAGVDPNSTSEEDQTALMSAALNGKPDAMRALLRRGGRQYLGGGTAAGVRRGPEGQVEGRVYGATVRGPQ